MLPPNILHRNKKLITIFHFTLPNSERENYHTKIEKKRRRRKNLMRSRNKKKNTPHDSSLFKSARHA